jgi:hypothetical protein
MKTLIETLGYMQKTINAPKGQYNAFGKYKYRNAEDILSSIKQAMPEGYAIRMTDEIVMVGDRYYIKSLATLFSSEHSIEAAAFARESLDKKGMDSAQVSGSTSSYARKYALCALFAIDDSKLEPAEDIDAQDNREAHISYEDKIQDIGEELNMQCDLDDLRLKTRVMVERHPHLRDAIVNIASERAKLIKAMREEPI